MKTKPRYTLRANEQSEERNKNTAHNGANNREARRLN